LNNPINASDPSGHKCIGDVEECSTYHKEMPITFPPENDTWGAKTKSERLPYVLEMMSNYHGEKWWSGDTPTTYEWAAFLYDEEGGQIISEDDKLMLMQMLLYKINKYGPAEFTPATNPEIVPYHERMNFTSADWNALTHPNPAKLEGGFALVNKVTSSPGYDINKVPNYLFWVDDNEMGDAHVSIGEFKSGYKKVGEYGGRYMVFLQAYNDFKLVIDPPEKGGKK